MPKFVNEPTVVNAKLQSTIRFRFVSSLKQVNDRDMPVTTDTSNKSSICCQRTLLPPQDLVLTIFLQARNVIYTVHGSINASLFHMTVVSTNGDRFL